MYEKPSPPVIETGETYDCVIVGGGMSGLAAALFFRRQAGPNVKVLILENHSIFGGEAKQNEFEVDGSRLVGHQGSAIYLVPYPYSFISHFYQSIGLDTPKLAYQNWSGPQAEMPLSRTPYDAVGMSSGHYGFWFGAKSGPKPGFWLIEPIGKKMQGAPISSAMRSELLQ